ncbi:MAG: alginate export family protein [Myxococcota bacterium]
MRHGLLPVRSIVSGPLSFGLGVALAVGRAEAAPLHEGPPPLTWRVGPTNDPVHLGAAGSLWYRAEIHAQDTPLSWGVPQRTRAHAEIRWRALRGFIQFQDVRAWGQASNTVTTTPTTGLHQGYLELSGHWGRAEGLLRIGRQQHGLRSRMLGVAPWNPNMRSFDAVRMRGRHGKFSVDVLGALMRRPETFTFESKDGARRELHHGGEGLLAIAMRAVAHRAFDVEAYALLWSQAPKQEQPERDRVVFTPGALLVGEPWRGLSYELEGYGQLGRWDGLPHEGWLGAVTLAYQWHRGPNPRVEGGFLAISGSECEQVEGQMQCDREIHRDFDSLLGARHRYLGMADILAPTNARDLWGAAVVSPGGWSELRTEVHALQRQESTGRWFRTSYAIVGSGPDSDERRRLLGVELDLQAVLHPWGPLTLDGGYGLFIPAAAGARQAGSRPMHLGYVITQLSF